LQAVTSTTVALSEERGVPSLRTSVGSLLQRRPGPDWNIEATHSFWLENVGECFNGTATASKTEEMLIDWLRDAHAMEKHAEQVLSTTASRIENYPELKTQLERHAQQTRRQADLIRECLDRHDGGASTMKDTAGRVMGFAQ
jgi:hypothetical protein